jgi:type II secretory pathway pseudopilin PulG
MQEKFKKGFTLIEILVVITITITLFIGASKINFNRMSDKQQSLVFTNNVYSSIETVRNNSLL